MAQEVTPPWAKRIEQKIDKLLSEDICYHHKKYGAETKKKCDPPCKYALSLMNPTTSTSLSPIVESILKYMKPIKFISPIRGRESKNKLEEEVSPIGHHVERKERKDGGRMLNL